MWKHHHDRLQDHWVQLIEPLSSAYLSWQNPDCQSLPAELPAAATTTSSWNFHINVIDIYTLKTQALIVCDGDSNSITKALACNSYLLSTPETPSIAISFRTLKLYY
jgi:hypothetical protein